jgi:hypothetical protein
VSDDRTDEQRAADAQLEGAIAANARAYGHTGIITGFVVCVAVTDVDDDDVTSGVSWLLPGGHQQWVTTLGILEAVRLRFRAMFMQPDED